MRRRRMKTDEDITDEQLLKIARWDIDNQRDNGTMRSCGEEVTEDCENFYTIISYLTPQHKDEQMAEVLLWKMFRDEYPQYLGDER
jgi:hypothetical protein